MAAWMILVEIDCGGAPNEYLEVAVGLDSQEDAERAVPAAIADFPYRIERVLIARAVGGL